MEQDIKILEEVKDMFMHLKNYGWINDIKKDIDTDKVIRAIEHLIKAYKELEEKNKKKSIEIICYQEELENSIPVSLVEEKIEELNKLLEEDLQDERKVNSNRFIIICQCKNCLQELLEKRK